MKFTLPSISQLRIFDTLHWAARYAFTKAGYRWEVRRTGDLQIGLWRIGLNGTRGRRKASAKRLVLVPGFGDTSLSWYPVLALLTPVLKRKYDELVVLDFPGYHGFLSDERCVPSMDLLIQATSDVLDSLRPDTVLGHSLGGWLAAHYACACGKGERPQAKNRQYTGPKTFILADPSGVFGEKDEKEAWRKKFEAAIEEGFHRFRPLMFAKEPFLFRFLAREFSGFLQREDTVQFMLSVRDDHEVVDHLGEVKAKVWLLWGEKDGLSPVGWAPQWLDRLKQAEAKAIILKGIGHSIQMESPAVVAAVLAQILLDKEPHRAGRRWWELVPA